MNHQPSTTPQNSPVANSSPVHPPLIPHSKEVRTQSGSSQALLRHTQVFTYRCYLPVLTGLGEPGLRKTWPSSPLTPPLSQRRRPQAGIRPR